MTVSLFSYNPPRLPLFCERYYRNGEGKFLYMRGVFSKKGGNATRGREAPEARSFYRLGSIETHPDRKAL